MDYYFKVGRSSPVGNRDTAGITGVENKNSLISSLISSNLVETAQNKFVKFVREASTTSHKMMWGVGTFLLSTGESVNFMWDVAMNTLVNLLKTGGDTHHVVATSVSDVPFLGYVVSAIDEVIKTSLEAMVSIVNHDVEVRKRALDSLKQKMAESRAKLSGRTNFTTNKSNNNNVIIFPPY